MPTVTTTTTTKKQVTIRPALARKLRAALEEYASIDVQMKALEAAKAAAKSSVEDIQNTIGEDKIEFDDGYKVTLVSGATSSKIDPQLLVQEGVTTAQIERATITTPKKPYVLITLPKEKK